jgi:hypothetical protein
VNGRRQNSSQQHGAVQALSFAWKDRFADNIFGSSAFHRASN